MRTFETTPGVAFALVLAVALGAGGTVLAQSQAGKVPGIFHSFSPAPAAPRAEAPRPLFGPDFRRGREAYREGDFGAAREFWEGAAEDGDLFAQWRLANMYRLGQGVPVDHAKAFSFYRKVAAQHENEGYLTPRTRITVDAMVRLADYYRTGLKQAKVAADARRAFRLYHLAATHFGHPRAQFALGEMYCRGEGVRKDTGRGMRWYMLAARKGSAPAQAALAELYQSGEAVPRSRVRALMWYSVARENAAADLAQQLANRQQALLEAASEEERLKAQNLATLWNEKYPPRSGHN